jgi:hypothetical protein
MDRWLYFGCHGGPGRYVWREGMGRFGGGGEWGGRSLSNFDGMLPPQGDPAPYIATVSRLEGWGLTALAFWDYSVDKRGGCNSVVFAPSLTITPDELLTEAQARFPQVFGRLPQVVRLKTPNVAINRGPTAPQEQR